MGRHRLDRLELVENGSNPPPCIVAVRNLSQREESFPPLVPTILLVFHMCFTVVFFVCSFTEIYSRAKSWLKKRVLQDFVFVHGSGARPSSRVLRVSFGEPGPQALILRFGVREHVC